MDVITSPCPKSNAGSTNVCQYTRPNKYIGLGLLYCSGLFNTLRPRQNGRHFTDNMLKCILFQKNVWIWIKISLKFVPRGPINNIPALVQIMAWRRTGDKPLPEPMMTQFSNTYVSPSLHDWIGLDMFNDDTRPTEHISRPTQVGSLLSL